MNTDRITTEVTQMLSAAQVAEYRLLPYELTEGVLHCYAMPEVDYKTIISEVEVITGCKVETEVIEADKFEQLTGRYYRSNATRKSATTEVSSSGLGHDFLMKLIGEAYGSYASDIHFELYEERCRIRMRIDGKLMERYVIDRGLYPPLVNQIKIQANLDISEKRLPQDGRIGYSRGDLKFDVRVSSLPTIYGEKIVLRLLTRHVELLDIEKLGLTDRQLADYKWAAMRPHGLVLISGPTGSGKSTTLYATLRLLNNDTCNILTIEDPVEYTLEGVNQVPLKEEIGLTFSNTLRTFLRQDPDIIMLGEIRDSDTAQMAIRSSLTGHLILSTIHTNSAWGSISRLIDMEVHPSLISNTLILSAAQRLVRTLCPQCKQPWPADNDMSTILGDSIVGKTLYRPTGCPECFFTGYKGRRAIYEVIPIDSHLSEMIRKGNPDIDQYLKTRGITTLADAAKTMLAAGDTSIDEILPIISS